MELLVRQIDEEDASAVTILCQQLGYHLSDEQVFENIRLVRAAKDHEAFVAVHESEVIGWIGVCQAVQIEATRYSEIRGLVVDDRYRNKGVGKLLIEEVKQWSRTKGNKKLRLRCNMTRKETHQFYQHLGFREVKEQKVFEIVVESSIDT